MEFININFWTYMYFLLAGGMIIFFIALPKSLKSKEKKDKEKWTKQNDRKHQQQKQLNRKDLAIKEVALKVKLEDEKAIFENNLKNEKNNIENENKIAISNIEKEYKQKSEEQHKLYEIKKTTLEEDSKNKLNEQNAIHQQELIEKKNNKPKSKINEEEKEKMLKDNLRKGRDYEIYVIDYFRKQGYKTQGHGLVNGKKDKGIDVIIMKNKNITLIQCKNWKKDGNKIIHKDLKEFLGNTTAFLENNKEKAKGYNIKFLFVTSNDVLDNSARYFLRDNKIVEHRIIPMEYK